jgi:hypothetical protein
MRVPVVFSLFVTLFAAAGGGAQAAPLATGAPSAQASLDSLRRVMDQFHDRFPVYDDISSAGNHFHAWAKIPDQNAAVSMLGAWTDNPHSGATAIRAEFDDVAGPNFGGFYMLNGILPAGAQSPQLNFGTIPNAGIDLTGATTLTFWARGQRGGEAIEFFVGGVGRDPSSGLPTFPYPDSTPVVKSTFILTQDWRQYRLSLTGKDLHYVLGGFGWDTSDTLSPGGAVFFLDDIQFELSPAAQEARLNQPRFLRSFTTAPNQLQPPPVSDFDFVNRNVAHTYDNALALLAFLSDGTADSLRRARLIGDAFVYAIGHDRTYNGDRLRDAYAGGDLALPPGWTPNNRVGTVPIPGFFTEDHQAFIEIEQNGMSTGNNAWAATALLALFQRTSDSRYLNAAKTLGSFISTFRNDSGTYQGFQGGLDDPETASPKRRPWASTEHNLDVTVAFTMLYALTGDSQWATGAEHSRQLVDAMWDEVRGCNLTGTLDPETRNAAPGQLPVDVQSWTVLAVPGILARHPGLLDCAEHNHRTTDAGFSGFDFNDDRDGVWFEGTAHMAVAYVRAGNPGAAEALRQTLAQAQATPPFGDGFGVAAASRNGLTTGFGFFFFQRLHVGATAWNVFAQSAFNPFYAAPASNPGPCLQDSAALCLAQARFKVTAAWQTAPGVSGQGTAVPLTADSGYFWFFSDTNVEVVLKVLDACQGFNRFWVFAAGLTNVGVDITVEDTQTGVVRHYANPQGTAFQPILDTQAFGTCP